MITGFCRFSLYDLRVFGKGGAPSPGKVAKAEGKRDAADGRKATFVWQPASNTEFYVVRFGTRRDQLTQNYQVYDGQTSLTVASLNVGVKYYVAVGAVNESGITPGRVVGEID